MVRQRKGSSTGRPRDETGSGNCSRCKVIQSCPFVSVIESAPGVSVSGASPRGGARGCPGTLRPASLQDLAHRPHVDCGRDGLEEAGADEVASVMDAACRQEPVRIGQPSGWSISTGHAALDERRALASDRDARAGQRLERGFRATGHRQAWPRHSLCAPSILAKSRSKVPSGVCPAFRATSTMRQSENPTLRCCRNCATAAATVSES